MNKLEFNKLDIQDQVNFLNNELSKNTTISVTRLCKQLFLNKSTVVDRFTKAGYKYNHEIRQYSKGDTVEVIQKDSKSITNKIDAVPEVPKENNITGIPQEQLQGLLELLELKDQLKELIQNNIKSKNIVEVDLHELKIDKTKFEGELKGRLVKVYDNVNNSWIKFCKENNQFKMQDLYSMALLEFMDKYKK